jgi:tyrosyl-tRNA synthetase
LPDEVVGKYLKMFTLLPISKVAEELDTHFTSPDKRIAQHLLANEVVTMIHGAPTAARAAIQTRLLFPAPGDRPGFSAREILENFAGNQHGGVIEVPRDEVVGQLVSKLARRIGAVNTRGEADNMIKGGGLYVGLENEKVADVKVRVEEEWLVDGEVLMVRFGKGRFVIVKVV